MPDDLRVAVIGCGGLGRKQAQIAAEMEGIDLIGVSDVIEDSARETAEQLGVPLYSRQNLLFCPGDMTCPPSTYLL